MNYDYVILLCADKKGPDGRFPDFRNGDYIGGENRMTSLLNYSLENLEPTYIIAGGFDEKSDRSQKITDMEQFLKKGNPEIKLVCIPTLPCVRHNLIAVFNQMGAKLKGKKIAIFTTFCFVARTMAIWSKLVEEEFPKIPMPHVMCAESFLKNEEVVLSNMDLYVKRTFREKQGLYDLEMDCYVDFCLEKETEKFVSIARKLSYLTSKKDKEKYNLVQVDEPKELEAVLAAEQEGMAS